MFYAGYISLGFLVGGLCGITSAEITTGLTAAVMVFAGSTATVFVSRDAIDRTTIGQILLSFSASCALGLILGIMTKENRWLTLSEERKSADQRSDYLRANLVKDVDAIDQKYRNGDYTAETAYTKLHELLKSKK